MMKLTDLIQNSAYTVYPETAALHALSVSDIAYNSKKAGAGHSFRMSCRRRRGRS